MAAHQGQDSPAQSASRNIESAQHFTSASVAGWRQLKWHQEQEREWEGILRSLRQCISELLITNRDLRNPQPSTINQRYREPDNEYDRSIARNRS
jgi:hypothetical protein